MVEVSDYLIGFNSDAALGGVYSGLPEGLQFLPMTVIVTMTIALVYGAVVAIARAFSAAEVERFAQAELLNAAATILMVSFLIIMLNGAELFALQYFICGGGVCPVIECGGSTITIDELSNTIDLVKCRIADKAASFASIQEQVTIAAAVPLNLLNIYISLMGVPVFSGQYVAAWYKDAETYRLINSFLTVLLIGMNALIVVAGYVKNSMLNFFLPIGLLLRSFFFTRGIGAFLMAVAIGFYFIYPVIYIMTDPGFVKPAFSAPAKPPEYESPLCVPTFGGLAYSMYSAYGSKTTSDSAAATLSLSQLKSDVTAIYSSVLLQPFIAFAITIVIVRYMITVLGGESMDVLRAVAKVV